MADWVEALGTLLAFGLAVLLFWRQVADRRAEQASKIHVLTARNESYSASAPGGEVERGGHVKYVLTNTSDAPAYMAVVALLPWDATVSTASIRTQRFESLFPNDRTTEYQISSTETMAAADDWNFQQGKRAPLSIEFTDGRGRRWKRMPDGQLWLQRNDRWKRQR